MSDIKINPPKIKTSLNLMERKNVLYQVAYELFSIFEAPKMRHVSKVLYSGIIRMQAINSVCLRFFSKEKEVVFFLELIFDWETYEVLINTSRRDIEVIPRISSLDQFIGRKLSFQYLYNYLLRCLDIHKRIVFYDIPDNKIKSLEKFIGKVTDWEEELKEDNLKKISIKSKELEECNIKMGIKRGQVQQSSLRAIKNRLRNILS